MHGHIGKGNGSVKFHLIVEVGVADLCVGTVWRPLLGDIYELNTPPSCWILLFCGTPTSFGALPCTSASQQARGQP